MNKAILLCCWVSLLICSKANNDKQMTWSDTKSGKEGPVPMELKAPLEQIARKQSKGLDNANVMVNRAYNYNGYGYLEALEGAKLVAVDVEFSGYREELKRTIACRGLFSAAIQTTPDAHGCDRYCSELVG